MRMLRQVLFSFYFIFSFFFQCFFSRKNRFTNDVLHKSHKRLNEGSRLGTLPLYGWKRRQKANETKVVLTSFLEDLSILCDLIFSWRPMEFWWIFWNKNGGNWRLPTAASFRELSVGIDGEVITSMVVISCPTRKCLFKSFEKALTDGIFSSSVIASVLLSKNLWFRPTSPEN